MRELVYASERLVTRRRGTLPVLLACPHGGTESVPGVPERSGGATPAGCNFDKSADLATRELTFAVAQQLFERFGEAPYVVAADFHRRHLDVNRRRDCAYEVEAARPFYDEYHAVLRAAVDEIRAENAGLGLLFDVHGTGGVPGDPADLYLGTDNGRSVSRLLRADPLALFRRRSLRGRLEALGRVVSPHAPGQPETPTLDGGFTVQTYGSANADGIDAMQLEVVRALRTDADARAAFAEELACAIGGLVSQYADVRTLAAVRGEQAQLRAAARPGFASFEDANGVRHALWIDTRGRVRTSPPSALG